MTPIAYINVEKRRLEFAEPIKWNTPTVANLERIPLYTQRTWVGLTDEDKHEIELRAGITEDDDGYIVSQVFKLTEAKLKEKNT